MGNASGTAGSSSVAAMASASGVRAWMCRAASAIRGASRKPRFSWKATTLCASACASATSSGASSGVETMSESTVPASTEASWSRSPSRMSRADGATASSRHRMRRRSIMEASSTRITSASRGCSAWCLTCPSGRIPSSLCTVRLSRLDRVARTASLTGSRSSSSAMASFIRAAALPVGAASTTRSGPSSSARGCSSKSPRMRLTLKVLPSQAPP